MAIVKQVLPKEAFHGREQSPKVIMTDDSLTDRNMLAEVWPKTTLLFAYFICYRATCILWCAALCILWKRWCAALPIL